MQRKGRANVMECKIFTFLKIGFHLKPILMFLGSTKWLTLKRYNLKKNNTKECLASLKGKGYSVIIASPHSRGYSPENLPFSKPIALIFSTELGRLTDETLGLADEFMQIPIMGFTQSFNVSVSAAICINDLCRRIRCSEGIQW